MTNRDFSPTTATPSILASLTSVLPALALDLPVPEPPRQLPVVTPTGTANDSFSPHTATGMDSAQQTNVSLNNGVLPRMDSSAPEHSRISPPPSPKSKRSSSGTRLNKFVRRLHDMLQAEQNSGIVEWRRGLLVLHSTDAFSKTVLPRYFNTRNFKTFRRQLNYYGFVHVRSFSTTGSTTTALWVNRDLAKQGNAGVSSVLMLKRVEPCDSAKTAEGRRVRKELAVSTVEEDIGVSAKSLQLDQIRSMALRSGSIDDSTSGASASSDLMSSQIPLIVHCHGMNSTTTTVERCSSILHQDTWPHKRNRSASSGSLMEASSSDDEDSASAANLLLMLSKSSVACM